MMEIPTSLFQLLTLLSTFPLFFNLWKIYIHHNDIDLRNKFPVLGLRDEMFSWSRVTLRSLHAITGWASEGYKKYSIFNLPYIIPSLDRGPVVIIPPRRIEAIYGLPESVLDAHNTQNDTIQAKWTVSDQRVVQNPLHINVIRHQLTRNLAHLTPLIASELETGFEKVWGLETTEWKEIRVWDSCLKVIAGASNGAFCGLPLCRNDQFLKSLRDHAMGILAGSLFINATPKPFKLFTGSLVRVFCYCLFRKAMHLCLPVVKERLRITASLKAGTSYDLKKPKDGLQWIIDECYATGDAAELDPERICHRLVFVNDVSLHSTAFTVQHVILDLAMADPSLQFIKGLRQECETVLAESGGSWTYEAARKLKLVDSAIRESMRIHPFASVGLFRTVLHPAGIPLGVSDIRLPRGTVLSLPLEAIHQDEALYPNAASFDAFRFVHGAGRNILDEISAGEKGNKASRSAANLDDAFLGFGFGKHACPGRFFALNEMKIFVAHMLLNYEIEYTKAQPKSLNVLWFKVPSKSTTVRVRKRAP